jgi:hypothetical protein
MVTKKKEVVKNELEEGTALVKLESKEIVVDALHGLTVLNKAGWNVLEVNLDVDKAVSFCDIYEIPYTNPPTKANLMENIAKRF